MMGGYISEGFPFYFVNRRMLDYLGYKTEDEFVADIDGLISKSWHHRKTGRRWTGRWNGSCLENEYVVEYRMKKGRFLHLGSRPGPAHVCRRRADP